MRTKLMVIFLTSLILGYTESANADCWIRDISCGQTIQGELDIFDCALLGAWAMDSYVFTGTAGDRVTLSLSSTAFPSTLALVTSTLDPATLVVATAAKGKTARIQHTLPVSGKWQVGVDNRASPYYEQGAYTLTFQCSDSSSNCVPSQNALCLNAGRFKVEATYDAGSGNSGSAHVVALTPDTGYLWFFSSSNVEVVVKILDACQLNQRFWVFAGGLTNVRTVITVTDTQTGTVKTYTNPQSTPFKPTQDTGAFSTCH